MLFKGYSCLLSSFRRYLLQRPYSSSANFPAYSFISVLTLSLLWLFSGQIIAQPQGFTNFELVFSDEFNGSEVDSSKWTLLTGDGTEFGLPPGWGNNELQYYLPQNATVDSGLLTITAKEEQIEGYNYTSSRMITANKADFTYGRFEMRAKMPIGQGIWPAYWMFFTGPGEYGGWAASGEIDIMEYLGNAPEEVFGTIHFGQPFPGNLFSSIEYTLPTGNFNEDFHVFAAEWEPGEIRWYVDSVLYATQNIWWSNGGPYPAPFDQDFHLLLNLAVGGNLPGNPDATTVFPQEYIVDYVRVYQDLDLPTVEVAVDNSTPNPGDSLVISATPNAPRGLSKVEYFQGEFKLGETTTNPHQIIIPEVAEGAFRIRAKITDTTGKFNFSDFVVVTVGTETQGPYSMNPVPIPGVVEAEFFDVGGQGVAYNDSDPTINEGSRSAGNIFRSDEGVDLEATADVGGGFNMGFTEIGEWTEYTVDVQEAGFYNIDIRLASQSSAGTLRILFDGEDKTGPINFVPTGGFQTWADVRVTNVSLDSGVQVMRLAFEGVGINVNKISLSEAEAPASQVFDDMEHGDPLNNGWFSFGGAVGGGGIDPNSTDLPPQNGGSFSLQTGWGSGGVPGFFGGFGRENPLDLPSATFFNFWINPDAGQDYLLEINLQEDDNGDGAINPPDDDEFQYNLTVGPEGSGAEVISGGGWQLVTIPFSSFFDDNSFLFGGNGILDPVSVASGGNGELINVVFAVISNSGADVTFRTDFWAFSNSPLSPDISVTPLSVDFGEVAVGSCGSQAFLIANNGGLELEVTGLSIVGDEDFTVLSDSTPIIVPPGNSEIVEISFTPTTPGTKTAVFSIESNDPDTNPFEVPLTGIGVEAIELVFDDFEHGDPFGNDYFTFGGEVGGGGIGPNSTDVPPQNGGAFSLETGWGSDGVAGFFGGFGRTFPVDISAFDHFNLWINPDAGQNYTLEINIQEDDNGDNLIPFPPVGVDDEFQYDLVVGSDTSEAEVISGGGWQLISIPLADFFDDNRFLFGGNGILDAKAVACGGNGQLINVVIGIVSNSGADVNFRTDFWAFSDGPLSPIIEVSPATVDFGSVPTGSCEVQSLTITNKGSLQLDISALSVSGADGAEFSLVNGEEVFSLAPKTSQQIDLLFSPTSDGAKAATLTIESNDPEAPSVEVPLIGEGGEFSKVVFDDMDHGDPFGNGWFTFGGAVGGGGIDPNFVDLPPSLGGSASLQTGWGSGGTPGFFGGFGRNNAIDVSQATHFNFWINPNAGQDFTIEVQLQDDDNGDNAIPFPPDGADDEFQYDLTVGPEGSGAEVISGGGWQLVSIPFTDFFDDNSFNFGGNGEFDPVSTLCGGNGQLLTVIFGIISNSGADVSFRTDYWSFTKGPLGPEITVIPSSFDFGQVEVGQEKSVSLQIINEGCLDLTIFDISLIGPASGSFSFEQEDGPISFPPRDTIFTPFFTFAPESSSSAPETAIVRIVSDDPDEEIVEVQLSGQGIPSTTGGSTVVLSPVADAKVNDALPDQNFGSQDDMFVRYKPNGWLFDSYLKFALHDTLFDFSDNSLQKAILRVFGFNESSDRIIKVAVFETGTEFEELDITFNNAPGKQGGILDEVEVNDTRTYYEWDVTSLVQKQLAEGAESVAFVMVSQTRDSNYDKAKFSTKEALDNIPELVLTINEVPSDCEQAKFDVLEDSYTNNAPSLQDENYGDRNSLLVRNKPSGYGFETFLKFDVSDMQSPDQVLLRLYGRNTDSNDEVEIGIYSTTDEWTEGTLTLY